MSRELGEPIEPGFEVFVAKARRGVPDEREWTYIRKDGTRFPVNLSVTARRDSTGQIVGFMGIANDITDRKQAEDRLRKSEVQLAAVFSSMGEGAVLQDAAVGAGSTGPS